MASILKTKMTKLRMGQNKIRKISKVIQVLKGFNSKSKNNEVANGAK